MIASNKTKSKKQTAKKHSKANNKPLKPKELASKARVNDSRKVVAKSKVAVSSPKSVKLDRSKTVSPKAKKAIHSKSARTSATSAKPAKPTPKTKLAAKPVKASKAVAKPIVTTRSADVKPATQPILVDSKAKVNAKPMATPVKPAKNAPTSEPLSPPKAKKAAPVLTRVSNTSPSIVKKIKGLQHDRELRKDLAQPPTSRPVLISNNRPEDQPRDPSKDRLVLMVRDPFWLHAFWDITRKSVERAKAALSGHWHTARPVLRLLRNEDNSTTSNAENVYKDIEIHGGVRHWYIEIEPPPSTFRLLIGFLYGNNRFHELARSNPVTPPLPGSPDSTDDHWADLSKDADRVYALSGGTSDDGGAPELQQIMQEKLKRPIGNPSLTQFGSGAEGSLRRMKNFHLELDAEMVVFGNTHPSALLTVAGEPVPVRSDGSYSTRVPLPNSRQVLTVTSKSRDGLDEQTVVIAVERNTKVMEPLSSSEPEE